MYLINYVCREFKVFFSTMIYVETNSCTDVFEQPFASVDNLYKKQNCFYVALLYHLHVFLVLFCLKKKFGFKCYKLLFFFFFAVKQFLVVIQKCQKSLFFNKKTKSVRKIYNTKYAFVNLR